MQQAFDIKTLPDGFEPSKDGTHAVFTRPIETSPNDERSYRLLRLRNDMEVLVMHDPKADKAAAAMDVHVGHLSDPDNLQGLAHFLEHLLFLGTTKYPTDNDYKQYLSLHAGKSNASTSLDHTTYHFEVGHEHLEGALDSCTEREIRAVNYEFKRNLQVDTRRLFQLGKHLSSRDHPYWHFGTGNLQTLQEDPKREGIDSREELIQFYHTYYSSSIMRLVILGQDSLDQLAGWVVDKFSDVRNLGISPPAYFNPPLTSKELLTTVFVKPIKDLRSLEIKFLLPDMTQYYTVQPIRYVTQLIGHEGKGSILSLLKRQGWANSLSAGSSSAGIGFEFFKITVNLTKEGLLHHEDITVIIFQYIQMLRQEGVKSYFWDEITSLASMRFRFKEMVPASTYVTEVARTLQKGYAPEWVLSGSDLIRTHEPNLVMNILHKLSIHEWRSQVVTQDTTVVPGGMFTQVERWYGVEYHVEQVSLELMKRLETLSVHPDLHMPAPNDYIPKNFDTGKPPTSTSISPPPLTHPILIKHTPLTRIWHKKDDTFWVPKVNLHFLFKSPIVSLSPSNQVKSALYVELIKDILTEQVYEAGLAGLSYSLHCTIVGFILSVEGYNDKVSLLVQKLVETMKTTFSTDDNNNNNNSDEDENRFWRVKDLLERSLQDCQLNNPSIQAPYFMRYLNAERMWTWLERLEELESITPESLRRFCPEMLARIHIEGLIHGNMDQGQVLQISEMVEQILAPTRPLIPSELVSLRSFIVPEGCRAVYQRNMSDPSNLNSAVEYYIQIGGGGSGTSPLLPMATTTTTTTTTMTTTSPVAATAAAVVAVVQRTQRALVQIMAQIICEPCFNQLRTIEQLGYIVHSDFCPYSGGTLGVRISVQSDRDPIYVEKRIEHFLRERIGSLFLKTMTETEFQKQVQSLIQKKLEKHKNLKQESTAYWEQIKSGYYDFEEIQEDVQEMRKVTLEMMKTLFQDSVSPDASYGKKLSVHIRSLKLPPPPPPLSLSSSSSSSPGTDNGEKGDDCVLREGTVMIKDMVAFKAKLELSRAPYPVIDLLRYSKL
ncbi:Insulinase (Peptidase M16) [Modicella reniformis]|uniref:Insulinase (Peptidase M16) n=1 Tax=Modicella reniformis TaxID=1440133 RepID=A0A9P6M956_9FUNG|nr:Insulinase (Peptidase M16) [Modicella reniformis]